MSKAKQLIEKLLVETVAKDVAIKNVEYSSIRGEFVGDLYVDNKLVKSSSSLIELKRLRRRFLGKL